MLRDILYFYKYYLYDLPMWRIGKFFHDRRQKNIKKEESGIIEYTPVGRTVNKIVINPRDFSTKYTSVSALPNEYSVEYDSLSGGYISIDDIDRVKMKEDLIYGHMQDFRYKLKDLPKHKQPNMEPQDYNNFKFKVYDTLNKLQEEKNEKTSINSKSIRG